MLASYAVLGPRTPSRRGEIVVGCNVTQIVEDLHVAKLHIMFGIPLKAPETSKGHIDQTAKNLVL